MGGRGGEQRLRGAAAAGKEARLDFCSLVIPRGGPSWPAWMESRAAGSLPGVAVAVAVAGPGRPRPLAHSYLQALQRKTNDSLSIADVVLSRPQPRRLPLPVERGPCCFRGCVCVRFSFSCLGCNPSFPKKKRKLISKFIFHQNGVLLQRKKLTLTLQDLEVKPP